MIVFSNTTPFIALASTGQIELLPRLFNAIHVADAVIEECAEARGYVPDTGDVVWLAFSPQAGREQAGRRPALVLSPPSDAVPWCCWA